MSPFVNFVSSHPRRPRPAIRRLRTLGGIVLACALLLSLVSVETSAQASTRVEKSERKKEKKAAAAMTSPSSSATTPATDSFEMFRTIGDRNIFDPNRIPRVRRDSSSDGPVVIEDVISFVGTMQYEKGLFAFFDGTDSRNRKALPTGSKLADFTVAQILPRSVEVTKGERLITLRIGESLRRTDGGEWALSTIPLAVAESPSATSSSASRPPASTIPSDASATLRRLMEMRQKQLKE